MCLFKTLLEAFNQKPTDIKMMEAASRIWTKWRQTHALNVMESCWLARVDLLQFVMVQDRRALFQAW